MKVEVELTQETYEAFRREAEERKVTVGEIVRERVDASAPRSSFPKFDLGVPKIPVSEWREVANEGRAL